MSKSLENLLQIIFGKSPNGTTFAEREREREREITLFLTCHKKKCHISNMWVCHFSYIHSIIFTPLN
jgi:hypothetical protein